MSISTGPRSGFALAGEVVAIGGTLVAVIMVRTNVLFRRLSKWADVDERSADCDVQIRDRHMIARRTLGIVGITRAKDQLPSPARMHLILAVLSLGAAMFALATALPAWAVIVLFVLASAMAGTPVLRQSSET